MEKRLATACEKNKFDSKKSYWYLLFGVPVLISVMMWGVVQNVPAKFSIYSILDDMIPFCEYFVIPYVSWFLYYAGTMIYFAIYSREDYIRASIYLIAGYLVAMPIFLFCQNTIDFRPEPIEVNSICTWIINIIYTNGKPVSACPSIHCYVSIVLGAVILKSKAFRHPFWIKLGSTILVLAICASTVLIKQHSILDVVGSIVLAAIMYIPVYGIKWKFLENKNIFEI